MNVLVIGGTRFVGRLTAERLATNHCVTVLSRNRVAVAGATRIVADRAEGLASLTEGSFDAVVDFIAYDETLVRTAAAVGRTYLAISSAWVPRLSGAAADAPVAPDDRHAPSTMLPVTRKYLLGKARLEQTIDALRNDGRDAAAVRLPIMFGAGDHTGRLDFYRRRVADGGPLLLVDGGRNRAQLLWSEDAAAAVASLVEGGIASTRSLWEALPDDGVAVADFVRDVATAMGRSVETVSAPVSVIAGGVAGYLDVEPLWREQALPRTPANVFAAHGRSATPRREWLATLPPVAPLANPGRADEVAFARKLACSAT